MFFNVDVNKTLAALDALTNALSDYSIGHPNGDARQEIDRHIRVLEMVAPRHSNEKIASFSNWMDILFSERKHQRYTRGHVDGATMVKSFALQDLVAMQDQVQRWEQVTKAGI